MTFLWFAHRVEEIAPKETKTNCCLRLQIAFQIETRFELHIFFHFSDSEEQRMLFASKELQLKLQSSAFSKVSNST